VPASGTDPAGEPGFAPPGPPGDADLNDGAGADRGAVTAVEDVGIMLDGDGPNDLDDKDVGTTRWVLS